MTEKKNHINDAQEKGFNATAAYGDPKENGSDQHMPVGASEQDSLLNREETDNASAGGKVPGSGIYIGQKTGDVSAPGEGASGRSHENAQLMDQQIEDIPANDPNAEEAGPVRTESETGNVRKTDSVMKDLAGMELSDKGLPASDQAQSDVPPADPAINDVPDADRGLSGATEHLQQNAADRTRRNEGNE